MRYYNSVCHCSRTFRVSVSSFHALSCTSCFTSSFLFYFCLPTGHCVTSNALKGKLLPSLCTFIPIILPVLTHSLWKIATMHLLGLPRIVCLYRKSLRPTEHIFTHFDVVVIFQFYLKWGGHYGDGTGTAKQVASHSSDICCVMCSPTFNTSLFVKSYKCFCVRLQHSFLNM